MPYWRPIDAIVQLYCRRADYILRAAPWGGANKISRGSASRHLRPRWRARLKGANTISIGSASWHLCVCTAKHLAISEYMYIYTYIHHIYIYILTMYTHHISTYIYTYTYIYIYIYIWCIAYRLPIFSISHWLPIPYWWLIAEGPTT